MLFGIHFFLYFVAHIALWQTAAVVLRGHDLAIGSGRTDGQQVTALGTVQIDLLGKHVGRFSDWAHHVVSLTRLVAGDILDLVIGLIEGRTDQIGKACIDDGEFLQGTFFNI